MEGAAIRRRIEINTAVETAWRTAYFHRVKDFPVNLREFLIDPLTGEGLDKSENKSQHIDPEPALDAWFDVLRNLNKE